MNSDPITSYNNILVIQTGFVGDMVLTTPLLRALRDGLPGAEITLLHAPRAAGVVRLSPRVDRLISFDKRGADRGIYGTIALASRLRRFRFDLVLSPHRSFRSGLLSVATGAARRIGFHHPSCSLFYTETVPYSRWESTFIRRKLGLLEPLGIRADDETPEMHTGEAEKREASRLLEKNSIHLPYAVLAPGSVWPTKRWPPEHFGRLAAILKRKGIRSIVVGGGGDGDLGRRAAAAGPAADITGETSLEVLAALLQGAALFVGNDSGTLHLARAARIPAVALFGPTGPEQFRFDRLVRVVRSGDECAPCSDHGSVECPRNDWICMPGITPESVAREAFLLIERNDRGTDV